MYMVLYDHIWSSGIIIHSRVVCFWLVLSHRPGNPSFDSRILSNCCFFPPPIPLRTVLGLFWRVSINTDICFQCSVQLMNLTVYFCVYSLKIETKLRRQLKEIHVSDHISRGWCTTEGHHCATISQCQANCFNSAAVNTG